VTSRTTTFEPPLTLTADGPLPLPTYVITCAVAVERHVVGVDLDTVARIRRVDVVRERVVAGRTDRLTVRDERRRSGS